MTCPYFGKCGGCQTQHIPYEQQLANKQERLAYLLKPFYSGAVRAHGGAPFAYRNRMDFIAAPGVLGFRHEDQRGLVDVQACPISEPRINELLSHVRAWLAATPSISVFDRKRRLGCLRAVVIRVADDTTLSFVLNEDAAQLSSHVEAIRAYAEHTPAHNVVIAYVPANSEESTSLECFAVKGEEYLTSTFCGRKLQYHSQGFFQNNSALAQELVLRTKALLAEHGANGGALVDAYGGVGTFGIVLADQYASVISIESHPLASASCTENIHVNALSHMRAVTADAEQLGKLDVPAGAVILLDPPRAGLGERALRFLLERKHPWIAYISCNPPQLARELARLQAKYEVVAAELFDLFPQTNHSEALVLLRAR